MGLYLVGRRRGVEAEEVAERHQWSLDKEREKGLGRMHGIEKTEQGKQIANGYHNGLEVQERWRGIAGGSVRAVVLAI